MPVAQRGSQDDCTKFTVVGNDNDINDAANGMRLGHPTPHNFTHYTDFNNRVNASLGNVARAAQDSGMGARAIRTALRNHLREIGRAVEAELATGVPGPGAYWTKVP